MKGEDVIECAEKIVEWLMASRHEWRGFCTH